MHQSQFNTLLWAACLNTFVIPTPDTDWPLAEDTFPWWRARPPLRKGLLLSLGHLAVDACHEGTQCLQCTTEACYHFASYGVTLILFVILKYLHHSREHTVLFEMMLKLSQLVYWSCYYNAFKLQPPQHVILTNQQTTSCTNSVQDLNILQDQAI